MDGSSIRGFDLRRLPPEFYEDPYPWYRALREHEPVKQMPDGSVLLTRHADCESVYKDPKRFISDKRREFAPKFGESALFEHHTTSLVFNDPPRHTRVRRLIHGALTPSAIAAMEAGLVDWVDRLLDRMRAKAEAGQSVDLIEDFASAIPIEVIGNLLDVPHEQRQPLREWSLAILGALEPALTLEQLQRGEDAVKAFLGFLEALVDQRRRCPGDPERDVLTRMIQGEVDGEKLQHRELLHNCIFLLNAGHETTTNLIGNALVLLWQHPDERARLVADPSLIRTAIEECLRFESSNQLGNRWLIEDFTLAGVALAANTPVTMVIGAANRDPAAFDQPERFDIARRPNRHLAFGSGIHQCAGMGLARLEGRVAVAKLIERFPNYQVVTGCTRARRARFRGFTSIPVALKP